MIEINPYRKEDSIEKLVVEIDADRPVSLGDVYADKYKSNNTIANFLASIISGDRFIYVPVEKGEEQRPSAPYRYLEMYDLYSNKQRSSNSLFNGSKDRMLQIEWNVNPSSAGYWTDFHVKATICGKLTSEDVTKIREQMKLLNGLLKNDQNTIRNLLERYLPQEARREAVR